MSLHAAKFEVFYDGGCPLCKREIAMIRRSDQQKRLVLTDIAALDFKPEGPSLTTMMREIHGRDAEGNYVTGVDVFREIYDRLGYSFLVSISRLPLIREVLDLGYRFFAYFRFHHAMRRSKRLGTECQSCRGVETEDRQSPSVEMPGSTNRANSEQA